VLAGPLTVIVPRAAGVAEAAAGGQSSIGLRCPAHPVARALLAAARRLGVPGLAAPSANRFGRLSPTRAEHVTKEFRTDLLGARRRRLRGRHRIEHRRLLARPPGAAAPGVLTRAQLEAAAGQPLADRDEAAPRASGTLEAHYAPRASCA
jgi:L-threonylcarbamoyladenylate synthase